MQKLQAKLLPLIAVSLLGLPISGFAATVGQQFRDIMAEIDAQCRKDKMGPYLDPTDPHYIDKRPITDCDILKIKPAEPLATEEGRFAYSIKLPAPYDKLKAEYHHGMGAETYFKSLCEKDAGEWIFKTVEGVEGVFQGRRNIHPYQDRRLVYWLFEYDEMTSSNMEDYLVQPPLGSYIYMERPADEGEITQPYIRHYRGQPVLSRPAQQYRTKNGIERMPYIVNQEQVSSLKSRYGFTWRQISTADMLENGITGGETIIYDRTTNEVLAFRRFFGRVWPRPDSQYTRFSNGDLCSPGFTGRVREFTQKVLVPINSAE